MENGTRLIDIEEVANSNRARNVLNFFHPANTSGLADPFFSEFIAGLGDETSNHQFELIISIASPGEEPEKHIYQSWVQGRKVDRFVLTHLHLHDWRV